MGASGPYGAFRVLPDFARPPATRRAVKLSYFMADDGAYQSPYSQQMLQLLDDLPQQQVHNVVFRDGGEIGDSWLYDIQQGDRSPDVVAAPRSRLAPGVTEVQSNNPKVLAQVLGWTLQRYPAKSSYLTIYTHGAGAGGIGHDRHQTDPAGKALPAAQQIDMLTLPDFAAALRQGLKGRKLDLINFLACLMGNVETMYELRGLVRYAVASENVHYSVDGMVPLLKTLDDLINQGLEPGEVAKRYAKSALNKRTSSQGYDTISAIDIDRMDELKSAINHLLKQLAAAARTDGDAIRAAYDATPPYRPDSPYNYYLRDLGSFLRELAGRVQAPNVQQAIREVQNAQRRATLYEHNLYGSTATGLSIFMPPRPKSEPYGVDTQSFWRPIWERQYKQTRFAKDTGWDEFLATMIPGLP